MGKFSRCDVRTLSENSSFVSGDYDGWCGLRKFFIVGLAVLLVGSFGAPAELQFLAADDFALLSRGEWVLEVGSQSCLFCGIDRRNKGTKGT